ncbi:hypothetical protein L1987_72727 [Smallanthus sonchifolius]|uniref:Uncharacterized protein n=1 Tax=Smallanthus sonchifolius TaxID=185202 RepID=A0ACB9AVF1_9ASTR|nr:hypothetical protein L1987_72727 [Smallanthus sonchifolius]
MVQWSLLRRYNRHIHRCLLKRMAEERQTTANVPMFCSYCNTKANHEIQSCTDKLIWMLLYTLMKGDATEGVKFTHHVGAVEDYSRLRRLRDDLADNDEDDTSK